MTQIITNDIKRNLNRIWAKECHHPISRSIELKYFCNVNCRGWVTQPLQLTILDLLVINLFFAIYGGF